jgi:hypothetical protein
MFKSTAFIAGAVCKGIVERLPAALGRWGKMPSYLPEFGFSRIDAK